MSQLLWRLRAWLVGALIANATVGLGIAYYVAFRLPEAAAETASVRVTEKLQDKLKIYEGSAISIVNTQVVKAISSLTDIAQQYGALGREERILEDQLGAVSRSVASLKNSDTAQIAELVKSIADNKEIRDALSNVAALSDRIDRLKSSALLLDQLSRRLTYVRGESKALELNKYEEATFASCPADTVIVSGGCHLESVGSWGLYQAGIWTDGRYRCVWRPGRDPGNNWAATGVASAYCLSTK